MEFLQTPKKMRKRISMGRGARVFNGLGLKEANINSVQVALDRIQLPGNIKLQRTPRYSPDVCCGRNYFE